MVKRLLPLTIILLFFQITVAFSQITTATVEAGPYTPGSTITATFTLGTTCISPGNTFELYLSDASGNFASETRIGTYAGFYSTFVNGDIPAGTTPGSGYKLRVKSTTPALVLAESAAFTIVAGTPVVAKLTSVATISTGTAPVTFGSCDTDPNQASTSFVFNNASTAANVTVTIINELDGGAPSTMTFSSINEAKVFAASLAHYTMIVKATANGTVGTTAYFLINNLAVTAFTTTSGNTVCYPIGAFEYLVNTGRNGGIKDNFPGNTYSITWGDGTSDVYTYCDIINRNSKVGHTFTHSSCGLTYTSGTETTYNAFGINVGVVSPFCGKVGSPLSTAAKVVSRPNNIFSNPDVACLGDVIFVNNSTGGERANANSPGCTPNTVLYTWNIDGVDVAVNVPFADFTYKFTTKGQHTIRLTSLSTGPCQADPLERIICIQDPPKPGFTIPAATICLTPGTLTPTNTSILDNTCPGATPIYTWDVSGPAAVSYLNNTSAASVTPQFQFTQPGIYYITLTIQSGNCSAATVAQKVVVNTTPTATLSPDITLCNIGDYSFSPTATDTRTVVSGTYEEITGTYQWLITGGAFTFIAPSDNNTKYPTINFSEYKEYTITLIHTNSCAVVTTTQKVTFSQAPVVNITANINPICNQATVALTGTITGGSANPSVVWDNGTNSAGFSTPTALATTYTPTAAERTAGVATLFLRLNTGLQGVCAEVFDKIDITILPENTVSNTNNTKTICTGNPVNFVPTSISADSFTWTATNPDGRISGLVTSGTGNISDVLTNTSTTDDATVVYTIVPHKGICDGVPFILTVTVTPRPIITAVAANPTICSSNPAGITLSSNLPGTLYTWTYTAGPNITGATNQTTPVAVTSIDHMLINNGTSNESITYTITPTLANSCDGTPKTVTITVVPSITIANAGPDETVCNKTTYTLAGNPALIGTGKWTVLPAGPTFADETSPTTLASNLVPGTDYTFRWTITGANGCSTTDDVVVKVHTALQNVIHAPSATTVCDGQEITINGDLPTGGLAPYAYRWEISTDGGTSWNAIPLAAGQNLTYTIRQSSQFRRIVSGGACETISNMVGIIALPAIDHNVIRNDQAICYNTAAQLLTGDVPTGGDGSTYTYQWEQSTDGGLSWTTIQNATLPSYLPGNLTENTQYRRRVGSGVCSGALGNLSNTVTITINPDAIAEFTVVSLTGCVPFVIDAQNVKAVPHPGNSVYTWYANNVLIGTGIDFPGYTLSNENESAEIKLVVTSSNGCKISEHAEIFSTRPSVAATFTQDKTEGCGPLTVKFTNTSASLTNATFSWDFGNGVTSSLAVPPDITFEPNPLGKDTTYVVTLTATTGCGVSTQSANVTVWAKALAIFTPEKTQGCSPFKAVFVNTSPGSSNTYYYDFGDNQTTQRSDKSTVEHIYNVTVTTDFKVRMVAENGCGSDVKEWTIRVFPQNITPVLGIKLEEQEGCAPHTVNFENNSIGANRFTFDFGDGSPIQTKFTTGIVPYTYTRSGTFTVTMTAYNSCSEIPITKTVNILAQPVADFEALNTLGCPGLSVQFKNNSQGGLNNSYVWDFGDGSPFSTEFEPKHTYNGDQEYYTVKLTATNMLGCPTEVIRNQYIHIVPPPVAAFNVNPSTLISIPDYSFKFEDESTNNPSIWEWDFGDGSGSTLKNPGHIYLDTGTYKVTLKVSNQQGCYSTTFKNVTIKGVPGYLYVPNSFIPGSIQPELRVFSAKGSGIKSWRFIIFNKWGQSLWETTSLDEGKPAGGWDGTFKGQAMPQGVYYWKIDVQMVNGSEWKGMTYDKSAPKRTGAIHLIR